MDVAFTDFVQPDLSIEHCVADGQGLVLREPERQCRSEDDVIAFAANAEVIVAQSAPITRAVLEALPQLRLVSLPQVGCDPVDLVAARELGVWVTNVPDANTTEVASHALAMTMALVRHLPAFDSSVRRGEWDYEATGPLTRPGTMTVGILGLGRIGRTYASYVKPCFRRVIGYDPFVGAEDWPNHVERVMNVDDMLAIADVLSVHMPLTLETRGMVNAVWLGRMKPGAFLVNVSRGPIVDGGALYEALGEGRLNGAALDVLPVEPPSHGEPLVHHPKVLLSPHAAFYSRESDEETRRRSIETIIAMVKHGRPRDVVVEGRR